jgi:hypothetical protein
VNPCTALWTTLSGFESLPPSHPRSLTLTRRLVSPHELVLHDEEVIDCLHLRFGDDGSEGLASNIGEHVKFFMSHFFHDR